MQFFVSRTVNLCNVTGWETKEDGRPCLTKHDNNYVFGKFLALPVQSSAVYSTGGIVWAQGHFCLMRNFNSIPITFTPTWRVVFSLGLNLIQHRNHDINSQ